MILLWIDNQAVMCPYVILKTVVVILLFVCRSSCEFRNWFVVSSKEVCS